MKQLATYREKPSRKNPVPVKKQDNLKLLNPQTQDPDRKQRHKEVEKVSERERIKFQIRGVNGG